VLTIVVVESGATFSHEQAFPKPDRASSCFRFGVAAANAAALAPFAMTSAMSAFAKATWAAALVSLRWTAPGVMVAVSVTVVDIWTVCVEVAVVLVNSVLVVVR
jgi:hypothetical protein